MRTAVDIQDELIAKLIADTTATITDAELVGDDIHLTLDKAYILSIGNYIKIEESVDFLNSYEIKNYVDGKLVFTPDVSEYEISQLIGKNVITATTFSDNVEQVFSASDFPVCIINIISRNSIGNLCNAYVPAEAEFIFMVMHATEKTTIKKIRKESEINYTDLLSDLSKRVIDNTMFKLTIWGKQRVAMLACTIQAQ